MLKQEKFGSFFNLSTLGVLIKINLWPGDDLNPFYKTFEAKLQPQQPPKVEVSGYGFFENEVRGYNSTALRMTLCSVGITRK